MTLLEGAILASRAILDLPADFDREGSPSYAEATWSRAAALIRRYAEVVSRERLGIVTPRISPGPDASIDIHWQTLVFELIVNVPSNPDRPATFYGDDYGPNFIKAPWHPDDPAPAWLALMRPR